MQSAGISTVDAKKISPFTYRAIDDAYLVANDFGNWAFLTTDDFKAYVVPIVFTIGRWIA